VAPAEQRLSAYSAERAHLRGMQACVLPDLLAAFGEGVLK
jgi:hypothetical protein